MKKNLEKKHAINRRNRYLDTLYLQVHLYTSMYSGIVSLHYSMIGFIRCEWNQSNRSLTFRERLDQRVMLRYDICSLCLDVLRCYTFWVTKQDIPIALHCFFNLSFIGDPLIGRPCLLKICNPSSSPAIPVSLPVQGIDIWKTEQNTSYK